jgi:hypothetical protein
MGSAAVREAHLVKYGAAPGGDPFNERPFSRQEQTASAERLSKPKRQQTSNAAPFSSKRAIAHALQTAARMNHLFPFGEDYGVEGELDLTNLAPQHMDQQRLQHPPSYSSGDLGGSESGLIPHESPDSPGANEYERTVVSPPPNYPVDWRRLPGPTERENIEWIYAWTSMEREETAETAFAAVSKSINKQLTAKGALPADDVLTNRKDVRSMIRSSKRFGVLVDIIATKRRLLSGEPHEASMQLYAYVEKRFPIQCVFMAVGITDNRAKRVARDVVNSDYVPGTKKLPWSSLDGEHMMLVHPRGDEGAHIRERGRQIMAAKAEARRIRTCTPKYVPPPKPAFVEASQSRPGSRGSMAWSRPTSRGYSAGADIKECDRCWRHGPGGGLSSAGPSRPVSRPAKLDRLGSTDASGGRTSTTASPTVMPARDQIPLRGGLMLSSESAALGRQQSVALLEESPSVASTTAAGRNATPDGLQDTPAPRPLRRRRGSSIGLLRRTSFVGAKSGGGESSTDGSPACASDLQSPPIMTTATVPSSYTAAKEIVARLSQRHSLRSPSGHRNLNANRLHPARRLEAPAEQE